MKIAGLDKIKGVITDVDGVLTDGKIITHHDGTESKEFNVKDGQMVVWTRWHLNLKFGAISGRGGESVVTRLKALEFDFVALNEKNKLNAFRKCIQEWGLEPHEILFIGDDFPDINVMRHAGVAVCPEDANEFVHAFTGWRTKAKGGRGVLQEILLEIARNRMGEEKIMNILIDA